MYCDKLLLTRSQKERLRGFLSHSKKQTKSGAGYTLIELIIVTTIISLLSSFFLANYRKGEKGYSLSRAASILAQDIRRVGTMTISTKECQECGNIVPAGYGIFFDRNDPKKYLIYADTDGNEFYTSGDTMIESIELEKGIIIKEINTSSQKVSINFIPPDPTIKIKDKESGDEINEVKIKIALESDTTKTKTITVNKVGLIDID